MASIIINVTDEQVKAVEGIVVDATEWLQAAWDGKASSCFVRVLEEESNLNPKKMTGQEQSDWVKNNPVKTRKQKDIDAGQ